MNAASAKFGEESADEAPNWNLEEKKMRLVIVAAALMLSSGALAAQEKGSSSPSQDDQKMICKKVGETGSRLGGKRICKSKTQWLDEKAQLRADLDRGQTGNGLRGE